MSMQVFTQIFMQLLTSLVISLKRIVHYWSQTVGCSMCFFVSGHWKCMEMFFVLNSYFHSLPVSGWASLNITIVSRCWCTCICYDMSFAYCPPIICFQMAIWLSTLLTFIWMHNKCIIWLLKGILGSLWTNCLKNQLNFTKKLNGRNA